MRTEEYLLPENRPVHVEPEITLWSLFCCFGREDKMRRRYTEEFTATEFDEDHKFVPKMETEVPVNETKVDPDGGQTLGSISNRKHTNVFSSNSESKKFLEEANSVLTRKAFKEKLQKREAKKLLKEISERSSQNSSQGEPVKEEDIPTPKNSDADKGEKNDDVEVKKIEDAKENIENEDQYKVEAKIEETENVKKEENTEKVEKIEEKIEKIEKIVEKNENIKKMDEKKEESKVEKIQPTITSKSNAVSSLFNNPSANKMTEELFPSLESKSSSLQSIQNNNTVFSLKTSIAKYQNETKKNIQKASLNENEASNVGVLNQKLTYAINIGENAFVKKKNKK